MAEAKRHGGGKVLDDFSTIHRLQRKSAERQTSKFIKIEAGLRYHQFQLVALL